MSNVKKNRTFKVLHKQNDKDGNPLKVDSEITEDKLIPEQIDFLLACGGLEEVK